MTGSPLSSTISQSLLKFMSIESVMPSNHLILCCPLLLLSPIFPSIRVFSNELALHIRWPKYWLFSYNLKCVQIKCAWFLRSESVHCSVVFNSLWSHGLYPTRLLCPLNSPGRNTGVGSYSLIQGIFPAQVSNPALLHCRQILYCLSHQSINTRVLYTTN